jgi:hypothetical protein
MLLLFHTVLTSAAVSFELLITPGQLAHSPAVVAV